MRLSKIENISLPGSWDGTPLTRPIGQRGKNCFLAAAFLWKGKTNGVRSMQIKSQHQESTPFPLKFIGVIPESRSLLLLVCVCALEVYFLCSK